MKFRWHFLSITFLLSSLTILIFLGLITNMPRVAAQSLDHPDVLSVVAVSPGTVPNDLDASLVITGTDFTNGATVQVGGVELLNVSWINSTRLEGVLPWGLDAGIYDLTVTNPGGESATLQNAISVVQGINVWTKASGPQGGSVIKIAINPLSPEHIYALPYNGGLFRSLDSGLNWALSLDQVAYKPSISLGADGQTVYVASHGREYDLWRSDDHGVTWQPIPIPDVDGKFTIYAHPTQSDTVFAIADSQGSVGNGLYRSDNRGLDWVLITEGLTNISPTTLGIDPINPQIMALGTNEGAIYLSTDGGASWNFASQAMDDIIGEITFHPSGNGEAWVNGAECGVLKSTSPDLTTWIPVVDGDEICFGWQQDYLHLAPAAWGFSYEETVFYVSQNIRVSSDGGLTWSNWGVGQNGGALSLALHPTDPGTVYVGAKRLGVLVTYDDGDTWQERNNGMTGLTPEILEVVADHPETVIGQDMESIGVYRLDQGGASWDYMPVTPLIPLGAIETSAMVLDPFQDGRLYLARENTIFISPDSGQTWPLSATLPIPAEYSLCWNRTTKLAADPFNPGQFLAGVQHDCEIWSLDPGGLYKSSNDGEAWTRITTSEPISKVNDIAYDWGTPGLVFAAEVNQGILRSDDGGLTWTPANTGLNPEWSGLIETEPAAPYRVYYANWKNLFVSEDQGDTWTVLDTPSSAGSGIQALHYAPGEPAVLYLATGSGLYASTDGGVSWLPTPEPLGSGNVWSMGSLNYQSRTVLYAGAAGGIYRLTRAPVTLSGTVTDSANGLPLEGAQVLVDTGSYTYTNATGEYSFVLPSGIYTLTASADGYYPQVVQDVELISGFAVLDFQLDPLPVTLTGLVRDADTHAPIGGAEILLDTGEYTFTNSSGIYSLLLDRGTYTVTAQAENYYPQTVVGLELISGTVVQDFDLSSTPVLLTGLVSDASNSEPISGTKVMVNTGEFALSNSTGVYSLYLSPGVYTVTAQAPGFIPQTVGGIELVLGTVIQDFSLIPVQPVPQWAQVNEDGFGDPRYQISVLETFQPQGLAPYLYAGTWGVEDARIWRSSDGWNWELAGSGWLSPTAFMFDAQVFEGQLYFGMGSPAQLWRTDGYNWDAIVTDGFGDLTNHSLSALMVFESQLYAAVLNDATGVEIWSSPSGDPDTWTQVNDDGFGQAGIFDILSRVVMDVYKDYLYVSYVRNGVGELWRSADGLEWELVFNDGLGDPNNQNISMAEFDGTLYIAFRNLSTGGEVWSSTDGLDWNLVFDNGLGDMQNKRPYGLIVADDALYLIFSSAQTGVRVFRTFDGQYWQPASLDGWGDLSNTFADYDDKAAAVFNFNLYVGTLNSGSGGRIWRLQLAYQQGLPFLAK